MAIKWTREFEWISNKLGISKDDIREGISHPTEERKLATPQYNIILYIAAIRGEAFVITSYYKDQDLYIDYVFKVKKALLDRVQSDDPVAILRELASIFGITVSMADLKGKFLFNERTPLNTTHGVNLQTLNREASQRGLAFIFAHESNNGGILSLECTIAFIIDGSAYFKWLSEG